jgi:Domain of unknown function (DUF5664)
MKSLQQRVAEEAGYPYDEVIINAAGGMQSKVCGRFDLIPPNVLKEVALTLEEGAAKYGEDNWKLIPQHEHVNHAIAHLYKFLEEDTTEVHLVNAICRLMFARYKNLETYPHTAKKPLH